MSIPDYSALAKEIFDSRPDSVAALRQICDETDARRAQFGEDDPLVQNGEARANAFKGMFTRRIAYACYQKDSRFGLRLKTSGAHAVRPNDDLSLATDVLLWKDDGQVIDVMSDRNVSWGIKDGDTQPVTEWIKPLPEVGEAPAPVVSAPSTDPAPPVEKPPVFVQVDLAPVLAALQQQHADNVALGRQLDTLQKQVQELADKPAPVVTVPAMTWPIYRNRYIGALTPEAK